MMQLSSSKRRIGGTVLLAAAALLIHGYHPYAEDAEIYLPGVLKILNPNLFPVNAEFFSEYAGHSLYPNLIAASIRTSHLPVPWVTLLWHIASIFLMLAGTWRMATAFFENESARWASVAFMAALLTLPVAGTALYILDQYLNPRSLAAFAAMFGMAEVLHRRYTVAVLWLVFAAAMQPFMASFAIGFCVWLILIDRYQPSFWGLAAILPFGITLDPPPPAYHEVALRQSFHFVLRWAWYEWIGIVGPLVLFWWFARLARRRGMKNMELVSRAIVSFVLVATVAAVILAIPARFEALARLQPLRCLALTYMLLIVIGGGLLGEYVLRVRVWRWLALFVPLSLGMYFAQRNMFPASAHIDWPWAQPRNPWAQAFEWIRDNTPPDALFALNPNHMALEGEDENGFRARAQRSMLADLVKDKGAASMFPPLSMKWLEQVQDAKNWKQFNRQDFDRLREKYGVTWVVVEQPGPANLACPYQNSAVRVCRLG
jgi:uncharacterized protein DUF6798